MIFIVKSLHSTAQCFLKYFTVCLFARLSWSLIFLLFSGFSSYLILRELLGYFDYSVVSIVYQIPAPFPAIQICNSEFLTKEMNHILKQIMNENYKNGGSLVGTQEQHSKFNNFSCRKAFLVILAPIFPPQKNCFGCCIFITYGFIFTF